MSRIRKLTYLKGGEEDMERLNVVLSQGQRESIILLPVLLLPLLVVRVVACGGVLELGEVFAKA